MDGSIYYDSREDGDQSPLLSPMTPNFDRYVSRGSFDDSSYLPDGTFMPLQSESCSISGPSSASIDPRDSGGFALDFLPAGDTMPRAYPGTIDPSAAMRTSPNSTWDMDGSPGPYPDRDSSEELRFQPQYTQAFDVYGGGGYGDFATSPTDISYDTVRGSRKKSSSSGGSGSNSSEKKKRKRHSSKDKDSDDKLQRSTTQLRTASRAPKRYSQSTARRPAESAEEVKARAAHNQVEQQYRKRLNQQFERLLAVLPQTEYDEEGEDIDMGDGVGSKGSIEKRISKAEVLDLARRRIKTLEKERASLERQKCELASSVVRLQDEWTRRLGGLPVKTEGYRE